MDEFAFRQLVGQMRIAQQRYFRTRKSSDLIQAKNLERLVDEELGINTEKRPARDLPGQQVLFGG